MPVFRILRQAPVTVSLVWLACVIFVGVLFEKTEIPGNRNDALSKWGASVPMVIYRTDAQTRKMDQVEGFSGPTDVWDGEWWRLLVNNLHHGDLLHLIMNGWAMIYLGRIIEPRMSRVMYLALLVGAVFTCAAVIGLRESFGVGLSGVIYAQIGLLMVWRDRDPQVAEQFPFLLAIGAGVWLLVCQLLTYHDILLIENGAHYAGFIYGWIWGQVYLEKQQQLISRFLLGASHLLLIPAFWFVMHPFWSGSWHWYLSRADHLSGRESMERLQTSLLLDPQLTDAWWELSRIYELHNDRRLALRVSMEGLKHNLSSEKLLQRTIDLWVEDELQSPEPIGPLLVSQIFDQKAGFWEEKLSRRVDHDLNRLEWEPGQLVELMGQSTDKNEFGWQQRSTSVDPQPDSSSPGTRDGQSPVIDPEAPDSAREGEIF